MDNVAPILKPDADLMVKHLQFLFGRALAGRIEVTAIHVDMEHRPRTRTRFFDLEEIEDAASFASETNSQPGWNVYVGAALRRPGTFPGKAAEDEDFLQTYAVWADADDEQQLASARARYDALGMTPPFVVVTGRVPEKRAQFWWPVESPITDIDTLRATLRGIASELKTDPAVCTGKQLMRLGGGVTWPKPNKPGRILELVQITEIPRAQRVFQPEQLARAFPPIDRLDGAPVGADVEIAQGGALGLEEKVMDGREGYAFRLVRAHLREYIGTNGAEPDADELYRSVAPVYLAKADQVRPGRGPAFLKAKVQDALRAYHAGLIPGMRDLEEAVLSWAERHTEPQVSDEIGQLPPADSDPGPDDDEPTLATPYQWIDAARIPPRDVLYGRHLFRKFLSATVAPGGLGKSSLEIVEALAMVTGRNLIGEAPKGQLRAWYWNGEDPMEELQRRIAAACLHYGLSAEDLRGRLFVNSGRDLEIVVARVDRGSLQIAVPLVSRLIRTVQRDQIDVLIIDPFIASHAVAENDNAMIEAVVRQWVRVADEGGCAVELVHHVRKPSGEAETTVDDGRGASAMLAKTRSARVLNAMSAAEADEIGIDRKERRFFFRVDNGKANLMPRGGEAQWRRMIGVPLGNRVDAQEDNVGVVTAWQKPGAFEGVKEHHLMAVRTAVASGNWRKDVQCSNWVGHAIAGAIGLDLEDEQVKAKVRAMIRVWLKEGVLKTVMQQDQGRRLKEFVIVGKDAE